MALGYKRMRLKPHPGTLPNMIETVEEGAKPKLKCKSTPKSGLNVPVKLVVHVCVGQGILVPYHMCLLWRPLTPKRERNLPIKLFVHVCVGKGTMMFE